MPVETRVATIRVTPHHPDFAVAERQLVEARRLGNTLNFVARKIFDQRAKNWEHNRGISDKRRRIRNPHAKLDALYQDETLLELGVVEWIRSNRDCWFTGKHNFANLIKIVVKNLNLQLNTKIAQLVGAKLSESWKSFTKLIITFWSNPQTMAKPKPPGYKQEFGYVEYNKQAISLGQTPLVQQTETTVVSPTGWGAGVTLPPGLTLADVSSARLTPRHTTAFDLEIIHHVTVPDRRFESLEEVQELTEAGVLPLAAAIDLGVDVLAAITFSDARTPVLVNGKPLKAINQHVNKQSSKLRSYHDIERENVHKKLVAESKRLETPYPEYLYPLKSSRLDRLWRKRNDQTDQFLHTASSRVIRMLVDAGVKILVIGWNPGFKTSINMGRRNNQTFAQIPLARFRDQLLYKGLSAGLSVFVAEESYTSKSSFLDEDTIPVWGSKPQNWKPSGRRTRRGLYKSNNNTLIHADVNASYNILAKHVIRINPQRVLTDKGAVVHPVWLAMPGLKPEPSKAGPRTLKPV